MTSILSAAFYCTQGDWMCYVTLSFKAFIVRQSSQSNTLALTVKLSNEEADVEHYLIEESANKKLNLESSEHHFDNVLALVYHYSTSRFVKTRLAHVINYHIYYSFSREELPTTLRLPKNLRETDSRQSLSSMALLAQDFWKYPMSKNEEPKPVNPGHQRKHSMDTSKATLEETLNGLQKVSDLLQASLVDLESQSNSPPIPPPRISSASPKTPMRRLSNMDSAEMLRSNQPIVHLR